VQPQRLCNHSVNGLLVADIQRDSECFATVCFDLVSDQTTSVIKVEDGDFEPISAEPLCDGSADATC
jgi:hypothetical protein